MSTENTTEKGEQTAAENTHEKMLASLMEASKTHANRYTICVDVLAPTKEQAHAAVGMMLRTEANMFSLHEIPYTEECKVEWESLRVGGEEHHAGHATAACYDDGNE